MAVLSPLFASVSGLTAILSRLVSTRLPLFLSSLGPAAALPRVRLPPTAEAVRYQQGVFDALVAAVLAIFLFDYFRPDTMVMRCSDAESASSRYLFGLDPANQ